MSFTPQRLWQELVDRMDKDKEFGMVFNRRKAWEKPYYNFVWESPSPWLIASYRTREQIVRMGIYNDTEEDLERIKPHISEIEKELGITFEFRHGNGRSSNYWIEYLIETDGETDVIIKHAVNWIVEWALKIKMAVDRNVNGTGGSIDSHIETNKEQHTMKEWIVPGNPNKYDMFKAFRDLGKIDWRQSTNIEVGDIVYIYVSAGYQQIMFKCKVNKINLQTVEIEDSKYDLSGEFDGTYGRYMELELIEDFNINLFKRETLQKYGFVSPQGAITVKPELKEYLDVVQYLLHVEEMNPDKHDGSYELARETVRAYKNMGDLSGLDYRDLNLLYHMVIGTWKLKIELKKSSVDKSNLPLEEKERLKKLLDKVWHNAETKQYENCEVGDCSVGMFGTGFYSFDAKDEGVAARTFLGLCVEILDLTDDDIIFNVAEKYLNRELTGLKTGSASAMLHCLKPFTFPVLNTNFGNNTIYEYFGIDLKKIKLLTTYISNCRKIKKFRDEYFSVKNYRIYDYAARKVNKAKSDTDLEKDDNSEFWPTYDEYPVDLTKEDWVRYLEDVEYPDHKGCMRVLKCYMDIGGVASPTRMSEVYKGHSMVYTSSISNFSRRALKYFDMQPCLDDKTDSHWLFPIAFQGKAGKDKDAGTYVYKMRDSLMEALKEMNLSDIELEYRGENEQMGNEEFDKNIILYGPPGTGKTYNTVIYAVAIIEKKSLDEVKEEAFTDYVSVKRRFDDYKSDGRIAFTTFHQSYGYEEFIEGIKPRVSEDDEDSVLDYSVESGVFKAFCEKAGAPAHRETDSYGLNKSPVVWKVSLAGTHDNPVREECLENGHIRIGWDKYGSVITDDMEYNQGGKSVLNAFINRMKVGDIILSCYTSTEIDAIGVVSGDYEWDDTFDEYKRVRKVNWILKGIREDIVDINGGSAMTLSTVYQMKILVGDVLNLISKLKGGDQGIKRSSNEDNYVFIIDEINRGNISKIFGELITLIEDTKRLGAEEEMTVNLPYSPNKPFGVPKNVYILGTMNTADRSIALMDTALRRRFSFVEMIPDVEVLRRVGADQVAGIDIARMLQTINDRIEFLYDREHTIGHAFFVRLKDNPKIEVLADIFKKSIIPLLQEYFYEDYQKIQLVLGDNAKPTDNFKFIKDVEVKPKNLFMGNEIEELDLPEKKYEINKYAFEEAPSYTMIYEKR